MWLPGERAYPTEVLLRVKARNPGTLDVFYLFIYLFHLMCFKNKNISKAKKK